MRIPCGPFREGDSEVYWKDSKCGVRVTSSNRDNTPIPCIYDSYLIVSSFSIALRKNGKWGIISHKNEVLCDFIYDRIEKTSDWTKLCMAMKDGRWGLIDGDSGSIACGFNYDQIKPIKFKTKAKRLLPGESYHDDYRSNNYYWLLYANGKVFPYDDNGNMIYPRGFDNIQSVIQYGPNRNDTCFIVEDNYKKSLLRTDGLLIGKCEYDEVKQIEGYCMHESSYFCLAIVKKGDLWGLIGNNCKQVLECEFDEIKSVGSSIAFKHENRWGIMPLKQVLHLVSDE